MELADFRIGQEFYCAGKRWRCTDVGSRVVVAICLEPHEVVSISDPDTCPSARRDHRHVTDEPSWFDGPPFVVIEEVFDEHSIQACSLALSSQSGGLS